LALALKPTAMEVVPLAVAADDRSRVVAAGVRRTAGGRSVTVGPARGGERLAPGEAFRCEGGDPAVPLVEAGFWRADALGSGFAKACGDRLAAADMAALLTCRGCIHQNADMAVTDHFPCGLVGPHVQVVAEQVNIKQLLADNIRNIVQTDRLARQHASQHSLQAN
ncbi:MAG: hypothetical protein ACO3NE_12615, partial [Alphaproteobacteria bacterium]